MNVELLQKIATKLSRMRHKKHFNMDVLVDKTECGTAACIAGYVLLDAGYKSTIHAGEFEDKNGNWIDGLSRARNLLRLTVDQSSRLFYGWNWPGKFGGSDREYGDESPSVYNDPKVAAKRIAHFIATDGRD